MFSPTQGNSRQHGSIWYSSAFLLQNCINLNIRGVPHSLLQIFYDPPPPIKHLLVHSAVSNKPNCHHLQTFLPCSAKEDLWEEMEKELSYTTKCIYHPVVHFCIDSLSRDAPNASSSVPHPVEIEDWLPLHPFIIDKQRSQKVTTSGLNAPKGLLAG